MTWKSPERNFEGVKHEKIRKVSDQKANELHDRISRSYYEQEEFRYQGKNFGVPDKELFETFHEMSHGLQTLMFHEVNKRLPQNEKVDEEEYRYKRGKDGNIVKDKVQEARKLKRNIEKSKGVNMNWEINQEHIETSGTDEKIKKALPDKFEV